ncbi:MAG: HEPN domain-containing protein [Anaerolineae bacterium]
MALAAAQSNLDNGFYEASTNRAYYAIFYAASGLLLTKGVKRKSHSGVLSEFRRLFVKPGLIEAEFSETYGDAMEARIDSDYLVPFQTDEVTSRLVMTDAQKFVARCKDLLKELEAGYENDDRE